MLTAQRSAVSVAVGCAPVANIKPPSLLLALREKETQEEERVYSEAGKRPPPGDKHDCVTLRY